MNSQYQVSRCRSIAPFYHRVWPPHRGERWHPFPEGSEGSSTQRARQTETPKTGFRPGVPNGPVRVVECCRGPVFGSAWGGPGFWPENGQNAYFYSGSPSTEHFYSPAEAFRVFGNLNHGGSDSTRASNTGAVKVRIASPFPTHVWLLPRGQ